MLQSQPTLTDLETFGVEKGLFPAAGRERGEALKWLVWTNASLGEAVRVLAAEHQRSHPG